ncbi:hypothetical protein P5V15_007223 [Pogonomyrmex californicus]
MSIWVIISFLACYSTWVIAHLIASPINLCTISTQYRADLKEPQPLLLKQDDGIKFWYPDDDGKLRVNAGESFYLACPGRENYLKNRGWGNLVEAVCIKNKVFYMNDVRQYLRSLSCNSHAEHYARYMDSPPCLDRYTPIEIGFNVNGTFIRTIEICRDNVTYTTYYTKFKMTKTIENYQKNYPRPQEFNAGSFYPGIDMEEAYKFKNQVNILAKTLKSFKLAKNLLYDRSQYLSRGHMVAKVDFVYGAQQRSTFWYLNTAPQWQTFNGGNWNSLEISVRYFAATYRLDLDVYTGVHGHMTMKDIYDNQEPLYLHALSVPKFYWKVIYDPLSKQGTAFVGLNDPFITSITDDIYLCKDISEKIEWLTWQPKNITAGISYACSVDDLREAVPTVPLFDVIDILI